MLISLWNHIESTKDVEDESKVKAKDVKKATKRDWELWIEEITDKSSPKCKCLELESELKKEFTKQIKIETHPEILYKMNEFQFFFIFTFSDVPAFI